LARICNSSVGTKKEGIHKYSLLVPKNQVVAVVRTRKRAGTKGLYESRTIISRMIRKVRVQLAQNCKPKQDGWNRDEADMGIVVGTCVILTSYDWEGWG